MTYTLTRPDGKIIEATEEQTAIIDYANSGQKPLRLILNALAGAAKTSTLEFLCKYMPLEPTLSLAFNKRIAEELGERLPGHVKCATMNSVGHRAWMATIGKRVQLDTGKNYKLVKEGVDRLPRSLKEDGYEYMGDMIKAVGQAKIRGYVPKGSVDIGKALTNSAEFYGSLDEEPEGWFIDIVDEAIRQGIRQAYAGPIDFDDQLFMPVCFGGQWPQFPRVMADEVQDFSTINHAM